MFWNMHWATSYTRRDAHFGWLPYRRSTSTPEKEGTGSQYSVSNRSRGLLNVSIQSLHACCIEWRKDSNNGEMHMATQGLLSLIIYRCCWATVPVGHDLSQAGLPAWGGRMGGGLCTSSAHGCRETNPTGMHPW